jgi:hypothetical protein
MIFRFALKLNKGDMVWGLSAVIYIYMKCLLLQNEVERIPKISN